MRRWKSTGNTTRGKYQLNDEQMDAFEREQLELAEAWSQPNRLAIAALCRDHGIAIASHDDATVDHVEESHAVGSAIAEFPTTLEAAKLHATATCRC